jgi:hypothetical protein
MIQAPAMNLDLEFPEDKEFESVEDIIAFLEPSQQHLLEGGTVNVIRHGKVIGLAHSVEELHRIVLK